MEQHPPPQGGEQHQDQVREQQHLRAEERLTDEQLIRLGITDALREQRTIDHATARAIASQLHGGQAAPLYALATSGALVNGLRDEIDGWRRDDTPIELEPWLDALDEYLDSRVDSPDAIEGWGTLWPSHPPRREDDEPDTGEDERPPYGSLACTVGRTAVTAALPTEQAEDEAAVRQVLFERITAAGVTTVGEVATVHAPAEEDEPDVFPWVDAATWSPIDVARGNYDEPRYTADELDELFGEPPGDEIGSVDELGWHGLVRHDGRPGGLILIQAKQGFRRVREAPDDDALEIQWSAIQQEHETFYEQREAYETATDEVAAGPSGHSPRIWVGSLTDYNLGQLYGAWVDATLAPDVLHAAVQFMLRNSDMPDAEEWSIFDYEDFGGYEVNEWSSFATVSLIAQGVAEHGAAYAAWVNYVGDTSGELLEPDGFRDHYLGEWDSLEDYVEDVLQETGFYDGLDEALQRVPEDLRRYVKVDVEGITAEWGQGLHVVEAPGGKVWVFDTGA